jgi:signal transduction histidine kinase
MVISVNYSEARATRENGAPVPGGNGKSPKAAPLLAAALNALPQTVAIIDANGLIASVNDAWRRYADENGMRWPRYGIGYNYLSIVDKAAQDGDPALEEMARGIRRVLDGSADSFRMEYSCESASCFFQLQVTAFEHAGARHALVSHENITLRKLSVDDSHGAKWVAESTRREEEGRREPAEHRRRIAQAVADTLAIASSSRQIEDAFEVVAERARDVFESQAAAIYNAEERWDRPILMAGCGSITTASQNGKSPVHPSILARAIADRCGVGVPDVRNDAGLLLVGARTGSSQPGYRALLVAPIQRKDKLYGYLALFYAEPHQFGEDDSELAHLFGQQVTLALENAELRSHAERAAVENERNRLARDLHDAVTQTLFSASVVAEALPRVWERDPVEGRRALEELRLWTRGALAELRTLLMELRPAALIDKPLPDLIRQLTEAAATHLRLPAICELSAEAEPPTEVKLALYRIAQEALNNMIKHSGASRVEVLYRASPRGIDLSVTDDGRGFDLDRHTPGQMGLGIMRERAEHVGARLAIRSAPGEGTEVRVEWRPRGRKKLYE